MSTREEFVAQMQAKIEEWNAAIDELQAKARKKQAQATQDYHAQLAELQNQRDEAAEMLKKAQKATEETWEDLKTKAERIWDEVQQGFQETKSILSE